MGKKEYAVVTVISNLTNNQASKILADITKSKGKHAPLSRGTTAVGIMSDIGTLLCNGIKELGNRR
jgi:hypothetical protein